MFPRGEVWISKVNPERPIPAEVSKLTGIRDRHVADAPTFAEIAKTLLRKLSSGFIVGYGSRDFDCVILAEEFARCDLAWDGWRHSIDVLELYRNLRRRRLEDAYRDLVSEEPYGAHSALGDAIATFSVLKHMVVGRFVDPRGIALMHPVADDGKQAIGLRADPAGYLELNGLQQLVYRFGKHEGKRVADEVEYARWMMRSEFPATTKQVLHSFFSQMA